MGTTSLVMSEFLNEASRRIQDYIYADWRKASEVQNDEKI